MKLLHGNRLLIGTHEHTQTQVFTDLEFFLIRMGLVEIFMISIK